MHFILVVQHQHETPDENCDHVDGEENEKKEKMTVVTTTDAIVHPGTANVYVVV